MKTVSKIISVILAAVMLFSLTACEKNIGTDGSETEAKDYATLLKLDMNSDTAKAEVTVKTFVDGDTTHFYVSESVMDNGVFKARYLAINTPESTGKIEEYGKAAANFTKEKLSSAVSIIIESDDGKWNADSTGDRYLAWVWYKTADDADYRNLNIEILQNGLAIASNAAGNRYGETAVAAINQAREQKLAVYSGQKDPDFYYGEALELTLKELRTNVADYNGLKVAFEGVITMNDNNSVYIEEYDPETGMYYGISIYYGFSLTGDALSILGVGNRSRIVGTVQYYEAGGTYQVSGLTYRLMKPDDPNNIQKISDGHSPAFVLTEPDTLVNGKVEIAGEDKTEVFDYAALAMNTSVALENLEVVSVYTTTAEDSSSKGAMTLTCKKDGVTVAVRTIVLVENGEVVTADRYEGKTIDVRGIIDYFDGEYQVKVFTVNDITIKN